MCVWEDGKGEGCVWEAVYVGRAVCERMGRAV